ncbi:hypothetical protein HK103_001428 [Boothiomyces macroporosus]|uniref:Uncharacterized protein n=1 Tax=Boothiomyces macroporosus TaxID=261099 RepID=A0AAD5UAT7_9FUNG|nr:hypothetical protein HK103_001428 [Boothiomyces macroporosus]
MHPNKRQRCYYAPYEAENRNNFVERQTDSSALEWVAEDPTADYIVTSTVVDLAQRTSVLRSLEDNEFTRQRDGAISSQYPNNMANSSKMKLKKFSSTTTTLPSISNHNIPEHLNKDFLSRQFLPSLKKLDPHYITFLREQSNIERRDSMEGSLLKEFALEIPRDLRNSMIARFIDLPREEPFAPRLRKPEMKRKAEVKKEKPKDLNSKIMEFANIIYTQEGYESDCSETSLNDSPILQKNESELESLLISSRVFVEKKNISHPVFTSSPVLERLVPQEFLDWTVDILAFLSDPLSELTKAFQLDLKPLQIGEHTIGAHANCNEVIEKSQDGSPACPDQVGFIKSYGKHIPKILYLGKSFQKAGLYELSPGTLVHLDDNLKFRVDENEVFHWHDLSRDYYQNLFIGLPNRFFPYNFDLKFYGRFTSRTDLLVKFFGENITFKVAFEGTRKLIYYTDPHSAVQKCLRFRAVELQPCEDAFIVNFNYAYPAHVSIAGTPINCISRKMMGGMNPEYF